MNQSENVEQMERKRHTEMDNVCAVEAWMQSMQRVGRLLDPMKALDVFKYVAVLGDPRVPVSPASQWLTDLLVKNGDPPTLANKLKAVSAKGVTKQFLMAKKVVLLHPQIRGYSELALRHRFIKGFSESARRALHEKLSVEMGKRGLASKPFPLSRTVLMDAAILTTDAFMTTKEKEEVPAWRDGAAGAALQLRMVTAAVERYFCFNGAVFNTGASWAAFGRLIGHVDALMEAALGQKASWDDSAVSVHSMIWSGDCDGELTRLAAQLPANLDNTPHIMQKTLKALGVKSALPKFIVDIWWPPLSLLSLLSLVTHGP